MVGQNFIFPPPNRSMLSAGAAVVLHPRSGCIPAYIHRQGNTREGSMLKCCNAANLKLPATLVMLATTSRAEHSWEAKRVRLLMELTWQKGSEKEHGSGGLRCSEFRWC
ncbi:hypothetical protein KIL84_002072 [Mauremys mutica]|uniref:Uncharacterized protein n=1 Tax=Mauremys mutica TaxID=74926 RepID=A0A9D4B4G8_9SAUR|nr:hypothetical protein KIL84_002072 [Mauremys mutica]